MSGCSIVVVFGTPLPFCSFLSSHPQRLAALTQTLQGLLNEPQDMEAEPDEFPAEPVSVVNFWSSSCYLCCMWSLCNFQMNFEPVYFLKKKTKQLPVVTFAKNLSCWY